MRDEKAIEMARVFNAMRERRLVYLHRPRHDPQVVVTAERDHRGRQNGWAR